MARHRCPPTRDWIAAGAWRLLATGLMLAAAAALWGIPAAAGESAPPAAGPPAAEKAPAEHAPAAQPASEKPAAGEPVKAEQPRSAPKNPRKPLTEDEVKELQPLKRFEIPIEKGEELLKDVRDNTFGYDESAFYYIVEKVLKTPPEAFKPDAEVTPYKTLLAMPSSYRGQPVTIRGVYMTAYPFSPPPLALWKDVRTLWECSIREHPINEHRPIATVIVIGDPTTYLRAGDDVVVKGYFYKVRQYEFRRGEVTGIDSAPMLVGRRLEKEEAASPLTRLGPPPALFGDGAGLWVAPAIMIFLVLAMGGVFVYLAFRTKSKHNAAGPRPLHRIRLRRPDRAQPPVSSGPGDSGGGPKP
jgi:hypothetical protein